MIDVPWPQTIAICGIAMCDAEWTREGYGCGLFYLESSCVYHISDVKGGVLGRHVGVICENAIIINLMDVINCGE